MSNVNLVKLRNLDPEVLAFIKGNMSAGGNHLPYLKQSDLAPYFNKNTDLVDELLVTDGLKDHIVNLSVEKIKKLNVYRRNADAIEYDDLDPELKKKIDKIQNPNSGTTIPQNILDDIENIKATYNRVNSTITELNSKIENLHNEGQAIRDSVIIINSDLLRRINENSNEIQALKNNPILSLTVEQIDKLNNVISKVDIINSVTEKIDKLQLDLNQLKLNIDEVNNTGLPGSSIYLSESRLLKSRNNLYYWNITFSKSELDSKLEKKEEPYIYDSENKHLFILVPKEDNSSEYEYKEEIHPFRDQFNGVFIYDESNSKLYYSDNGTLVAISSSNKKEKLFKDVEILGDNDINVLIPGTFNADISALILDEEDGSRTKGQYINSEGFVTVAYDENQIVLYNDSEAKIKVRIIYQLGGERKSRKDIKIEPNKNTSVQMLNPYSPGIKVLVLDEEENSRTKGQYINAKRTTVVARNDSEITIYNNTEKEINVRVIYS
nr:MAG TPA: hypothetical protein [Caudoviricetes sp.]